MKDVFVEVHDFGFGPACGFLDITADFADEFRWNVLAVGNAASYIRQERPRARLIAYNGFDVHAGTYPQLHELVPKAAPLLTMSNPGFANNMARSGHRVILIDQLDWFWPCDAEGIENVEHHLVQYYFGQSTARPRPGKAVEIRPILPRLRGGRSKGSEIFGTVIGLGGMAIAGDPRGGDDYARWLLPHVVEVLEDVPEAFPIRVVGGSALLPEIVGAIGDRRVFARVGMSRQEYLSLLRHSCFQILTPGLASIYEAAAMEISPLFQPGVNDSMLLQLQSLIQTGYPFAVPWPWADSILGEIRILPAAKSLSLIASHIRSSMRGEDRSADLLQASIRRYVSDHTNEPPKIKLPSDLPDGGLLLRSILHSM